MENKILIIEDEIGIRENLELLLVSENFIVESASNGKEGIRKANSFKPDLIICDIMMPDIDGYKVLELLSEDDKFNLVPFIFLTAKVENSDLRKGMNLGADDYIFKPFDHGELLSAVRKRLEKFTKIKADIDSQDSKSENLIFKVGDSSYSVAVSSIVYIEAERQYSNVYTQNKKRYIIKKSLNQWIELLPNSFTRIHRSTLINLEFVDKIEKKENNHYIILLNNIDRELKVSRKFYKNIKPLK